MQDRQPGPTDTVAVPRTESDPLVGKVVAERFRVLELVARGGMGKIYRAEQMPLGRVVALKVLSPAERRDEEEESFRRRFEREAAICARLSHSNTVRVFDFGWTADGIYYIAMEYIDGRTLHQIIRSDAPIDPLRVVHMLRQICGSLSEAHKLGIVHRDLKPGNVLLTNQGDDRDFVKVVDFGLVKHIDEHDVTSVGLIVGSPMYMSPEQVRGEDVDRRTDIYALGMLGYVCLSGKRPFERDTPIGVLMARMSGKPPRMIELNPDVVVPASLEWVVMTCLEMDRANRFESMHEVLRALKVVEAEIRGDHGGGPYPMQVLEGRTVLPPEFSDLSMVSRSRSMPQPSLPAYDAETTHTSVTTAVQAAGLSIVALLAVGVLLVAIGVAGVVGWFAYNSSHPQPTQAVVETPAPVAPVEAAAPPVEVVAVPVEALPEPVVEPAVTVAPPAEPAAGTTDPKPATKPTTTKPATTQAKPATSAKTDTGTATPPPKDVVPTPPPDEKIQSEDEGWKVRSEIRNPFDK